MRGNRGHTLQFSDRPGEWRLNGDGLSPADHDALAPVPGSILDDDEPDQVAVDATRFAGAGAALGGCFSVMLVVLVLGSTASISPPRTSRAESASPPVVFEPVGTVSLIETAAPGGADSEIALHLTPEQSVELAALERDLIAARTHVAAAEMRLNMLRASLHRATLEQAERSRQRAANAHVEVQPYSWMSADDLADGTRRRALAQLQQDQGAIRSLESQARAELQRRHAEVDRAQQAIDAWSARNLGADRDRDGELSDLVHAGPVGDEVMAMTGTSDDRDLRALITRHHARLIRGTERARTAAIGVD